MTAQETLERKGHKLKGESLTCSKCKLEFTTTTVAGETAVHQAGRQGYDVLACGYKEDGHAAPVATGPVAEEAATPA